jgi:hypothetical protein
MPETDLQQLNMALGPLKSQPLKTTVMITEATKGPAKYCPLVISDREQGKDIKHQVFQIKEYDIKTWLTASPKATKANSPPGASMRPTRTAAMVEIPNSLPTNVTSSVFPMIKRLSITEIDGKFDRNSFGSIDIPTWNTQPQCKH